MDRRLKRLAIWAAGVVLFVGVAGGWLMSRCG